MIQTLSLNDPVRIPLILRSRLRDGLEAYLAICREAARHTFEHDQNLYAAGALKKAPKLPPILQPRKRRPRGHQPRPVRDAEGKFVTPEKPAFLKTLEREGIRGRR